MHKVKRNELERPGICFLCEQEPVDDDTIDLERDYLDAEDVLTGRKYACSRCIKEAAMLLGFVHEDTFKQELKTVEAEIAHMREFEQGLKQMLSVPPVVLAKSGTLGATKKL